LLKSWLSLRGHLLSTTAILVQLIALASATIARSRLVLHLDLLVLILHHLHSIVCEVWNFFKSVARIVGT
jgi:hypothetical protein